jgi:glutamate-1-semialdehyde aminotransferase
VKVGGGRCADAGSAAGDQRMASLEPIIFGHDFPSCREALADALRRGKAGA